MDYLEIIDGHGRRQRVALDRPRMLIGREPSCDICLPHQSVSRRHAQLQRNDQGAWVLQDLNSLNHVYGPDGLVHQAVLEPGRFFRIADYRLHFQPAGSTLPETSQEPSLPAALSDDDSRPSWPGLDPGWLEQLQGFQRAMLNLDDPRQVLERLAHECRRLGHAQAVAVSLARPEGHRWEVIVGPPNNPFTDSAWGDIADSVALEDSDVQNWRTAAPRAATTPGCMLFPMKGRSGVIGHVFLQPGKSSPMPLPIQRYLGLYATHAGLVWDNLQLAALRVSQRALQQELDRAREIQTELFPRTFDLDGRLNAFGVNLPSVHVSGDLYDLVRTGPDTVAFVIADAMGHGLSAALLMAAVRAGLRLGLTLGLDWNALFRSLDELVGQTTQNAFATGMIGEIDLARGVLTLAIAGHPAPSLVVGGQACPVPPSCQTRPWGLDFDCPWETARVSLGQLDWSIVCFTDGVMDAAARRDSGRGTTHIAQYHHTHHHHAAEDLCLGLVTTTPPHGTDPLADDQTVLVLRSATAVQKQTPRTSSFKATDELAGTSP